MAKYIEREAAMDIVKRTSGDYATAWADLRKLPVADVAPVVHGKWICLEDEIGLFSCSRCDHKILRAKCNYCPNCGAKMQEAR